MGSWMISSVRTNLNRHLQRSTVYPKQRASISKRRKPSITGAFSYSNESLNENVESKPLHRTSEPPMRLGAHREDSTTEGIRLHLAQRRSLPKRISFPWRQVVSGSRNWQPLSCVAIAPRSARHVEARRKVRLLRVQRNLRRIAYPRVCSDWKPAR